MTKEQLKECYIDVHDNLLAASKEDNEAGFINTAFVVINVMGVEYETEAADFVEDCENTFENLLYVSLGDDCSILIDIDKICSIRTYRRYKDEEKQSEPTTIKAMIQPTDGRRISQTDFVKLRKFGEYDEEKYRNSGCEKLEFSFLTIELFNVWFERVKGLKFNKKYCLVIVDNGKQVEYIFGGKDGK